MFIRNKCKFTSGYLYKDKIWLDGWSCDRELGVLLGHRFYMGPE